MAKPQRAEFYLDDVADGRLRRAWLSAVPVPYGLAFALGIVDGWFRGLVMLVVCGSVYLLWMAWQTRRARRLGIRLDRHGLLEFRWGHLPRRIRWEDILDVELRPDGATLRTTGDDLLIDAQTWNWRRLTDRVVERLGLARPAELDAPQMSEEQVRQWLGVRPGEALVWDVGEFEHRVAWCVVALVVAVTAVLPLTPWRAELGHSATLAGYLLVVAAALDRLRKLDGPAWPFRIEAWPDRVEVTSASGRLIVGWREVRGWQVHSGFGVVQTTKGDFHIPRHGCNSARLFRVLAEVNAARGHGLLLPPRLDVPDGALSMGGTQPVGVDRGLSQAEE